MRKMIMVLLLLLFVALILLWKIREDKISNALFKQKYQNPQTLEEIKKYFENKTVALVGPAASFENRGKGREIDSHDIVVRVNNAGYPDFGYQKDFGSRTDVLFSRFSGLNIGLLIHSRKNWENLSFLVGLELVESETRNNFESQEFDTVLSSIPIYIMPHEWFGMLKSDMTKFNNQIEIEPNAGVASIKLLLEFNIKQLAIYGMDFYNSGYNSTHEKFLSSVVIDIDNEDKAGLISRYMKFGREVHNPLDQIPYVNFLLKQDPRASYKSPSD